ncbi:MAG: nucleotidyltransferase domain-containing protein [Candidatus Omnitrophica bacterium]|nr:nucleotidyltransferase domain-containing protein [Candidatus Omnitrophota bacterium]
MNPAVHLDQDAMADFCRKWRVRELSVFGSALREDFGPESDQDFLVSFEVDAPWSLLEIVTMKDELASMTGRSVDFVEREALRNPWRRKEILSTHEVVYASR